MDELEITCVLKDKHGTISHCGVKGYGIQSIIIIEKLIKEETCSFFVYDGQTKKNIHAKYSTDVAIFLTTDPNGLDRDTLNFLPIIDKSFVRQEGSVHLSNFNSLL